MQQIQQRMLEPSVLRKLLQTAVKRQHGWAVEQLCRQPAARQLSDDVRTLIFPAMDEDAVDNVAVLTKKPPCRAAADSVRYHTASHAASRWCRRVLLRY